jgi:serine-type D-Ala-D-Ala carboxypeptidase (penicillin-binding protein 5/6)
MSASPFMSPDRRRRRPAQAVRRRRRRRLATALATLAAATLAVLGTMVLASRSSGSRHRPAHTTAHALLLRRSLDPTLSPAGLPLGRPPLALTGLAGGRGGSLNAVQVPFHHPPRAGLLFNLSNGQVLWQRNALRRVPIASLTKMMTALLSVQSAPPDARVLVTREAVNADGSKVGVLPLGRHVRLESMLYGLMLPSGNDAAVALAQHVAGSVERFVTRMNEEAARLGLGCTRYSSPSGYYDRENFSCAADLAELAHVDLQQPRIASVVGTYSAVLPFPIKGGKLYLYNNNPLLIYKYPGVTGMKTGYTEAAGRCLLATAERHGVRLGVVVLNSQDPGTQARQLLNDGFERVYHLPAVPEAPFSPGV